APLLEKGKPIIARDDAFYSRLAEERKDLSTIPTPATAADPSLKIREDEYQGYQPAAPQGVAPRDEQADHNGMPWGSMQPGEYQRREAKAQIDNTPEIHGAPPSEADSRRVLADADYRGYQPTPPRQEDVYKPVPPAPRQSVGPVPPFTHSAETLLDSLEDIPINRNMDGVIRRPGVPSQAVTADKVADPKVMDHKVFTSEKWANRKLERGQKTGVYDKSYRVIPVTGGYRIAKGVKVDEGLARIPAHIQHAVAKMENDLKAGEVGGVAHNEQGEARRYVSTNPDWFKRDTLDAYDKKHGTSYANDVNKFSVLTTIKKMREGKDLTPRQQRVWDYLQETAERLNHTDHELAQGTDFGEMERAGYELSSEVPAGKLRNGDKVMIRENGALREYVHAGNDKQGNVVLEGERGRRTHDVFDMLPVEGVKRGDGMIKPGDIKGTRRPIDNDVTPADWIDEYFASLSAEDRAKVQDIEAAIRKNKQWMGSNPQYLLNMVRGVLDHRTNATPITGKVAVDIAAHKGENDVKEPAYESTHPSQDNQRSHGAEAGNSGGSDLGTSGSLPAQGTSGRGQEDSGRTEHSQEVTSEAPHKSSAHLPDNSAHSGVDVNETPVRERQSDLSRTDETQTDPVSSGVDSAAHEAATSPHNDLPDPTIAQQESGNYKKGHLRVHGLDITIENPKGSTRSGVDRENKPWSVTMPAHYGYIKRTEGKDGDHVDIYLGNSIGSGKVFVVDQKDIGTGKFDEHKVMIGFDTRAEAEKAYVAGFSDGRGKERIGAMSELSVDQFKEWLSDGDTKSPAAAQATQEAVKQQSNKETEPKQDVAGDKVTVAGAGSNKIEDFGEKIGGARKDTADRGYQKPNRSKSDTEPAWKKRFKALEKLDGSGRWIVSEVGKNRFGYGSSQAFETQEEAEAAIPLFAVAKMFHPYQEKDGKWSIYKRVSDRKRLKMTDKPFDSREEAMKHMAANAEDLLDTKTTFGEEILPVPDNVTRRGTERRQGDATPEMFMETFAPRGIEFGNWNNQEERQLVMNHAYDGLLDLADVLNIPPKALMLDGDLAIAFGARGQGLVGAKAHYEPGYGVINLTKMKGAGSLAHEWMHALDHYLARQDSKAKSDKVANERGDKVYADQSDRYLFQSHGPSVRSKTRGEVGEAYNTIVKGLFRKAEQYVEDTKVADKFLATARLNLKEDLDRIRRDLATDFTEKYTWRKVKKGLRAASAEQLAEFDRLADLLVEGGDLATEYRYEESPKRTSRKAILSGRHSNDTLDAIGAIYKAVRNRSGFVKDNSGTLDKVSAAMRVYDTRLKMFNDAKAGTEKTKTVPTEYAIEAKKMDQARVGDYWSHPHEMVARAFAAYVEDKIANSGGQNDFLVYHAHGGILHPMIDGLIARPYPEGKEREAISKAFDKFVSVIKTKETDKGVALYSKTTEPTGTTTAQVEEEARAFLGRGFDKLPLEIVQSEKELPGEGEKLEGQDEEKTAGLYHAGTLYLVADSLRPGAAEWFLRHEGLHYLLRNDKAFSGKRDDILADFEKRRNIDPRIREAFGQV
ncbi:MAG: LPD5 domain-containing protein, partial [Desulfobulbaceae bacterium]|nr:LPD5 domain-containing protein [Desulfobulbaceae bacterium]